MLIHYEMLNDSNGTNKPPSKRTEKLQIYMCKKAFCVKNENKVHWFDF